MNNIMQLLIEVYSFASYRALGKLLIISFSFGTHAIVSARVNIFVGQ